MKSFVCAIALVFVAVSASAAPINLIQNGDFSLGNTGFTSDYAYVPDDPLNADDLWPSGTYGVDDSTAGRHSLWVSNGDTGNVMLVNGRTDAVSSVWRQSVSLNAGHTYAWRTSAANLCCLAGVLPGDGPTLQFFVNGFLLGTFITNGPGIWEASEQVFLAASTALAVFEVKNTTTTFHGNDFALDNLSLTDLSEVPEPASMLLLGAGLLAVAALARRRPCGV